MFVLCLDIIKSDKKYLNWNKWVRQNAKSA